MCARNALLYEWGAFKVDQPMVDLDPQLKSVPPPCMTAARAVHVVHSIAGAQTMKLPTGTKCNTSLN